MSGTLPIDDYRNKLSLRAPFHAFVNWLRQCSLNAPSAVQSTGERSLGNSVLRGPVGNAKAFALIRNKPIASGVASLRVAGCPYAVSRLVIAVHIFAFNAMAIAGPWPHVDIEVLERVSPAVADCNSATAVIRVAVIVRVSASLNHAVPRIVFTRSVHSVGGDRFPDSLASEASARQALLLVQRGGDNQLSCAALASAQPIGTVPLALHSFVGKNLPAANRTVGQIFYVLGKATKISISHEPFLSTEGKLWLEPADVSASVRLASFYPILSQATLSPSDIKTAEYWANWGIAALILFSIGSVVTLAMREWWIARKPHFIAKWEAETEKEREAARLFSKLTESEGVKNHILETLSDNQMTHSEACHETHGLVKDIHAKVVLGK